MLNIIWFSMIAIAVLTGVIQGTINDVIISIPLSANKAFEISLGLCGIMTFWLGLVQIAQASGLVDLIAKGATPILHQLFPEIPKDHPALGHISLNVTANMIGLNNAATPLGIKAMESLQSLNPNPNQASHSMCMLLAINTSSIQLIPTTAIGLLAAAGSLEPTKIIFSSICATTLSTIAAILLSSFFKYNSSES
ncbi:nucleoside recognition protein [Gammaproteobacteria bacterium]|nr:nucleoside recognition protein [Gammaproteobacteria bacterium]